MNTRLKITIIVIAVLLSGISSAYLIVLNGFGNEMDSVTNNQIFEFEELGETIYVRINLIM